MANVVGGEKLGCDVNGEGGVSDLVEREACAMAFVGLSRDPIWMAFAYALAGRKDNMVSPVTDVRIE